MEIEFSLAETYGLHRSYKAYLIVDESAHGGVHGKDRQENEDARKQYSHALYLLYFLGHLIYHKKVAASKHAASIFSQNIVYTSFYGRYTFAVRGFDSYLVIWNGRFIFFRQIFIGSGSAGHCRDAESILLHTSIYNREHSLLHGIFHSSLNGFIHLSELNSLKMTFQSLFIHISIAV